jgi:cysteine-rich repeat protein
VRADEECDDGNLDNDDGCTDACTTEGGFVCQTAGPGSCVAICGDGQQRGTEQCDDDNTTIGDGYSSVCNLEPGFACVGAACDAVCGDGLVRGSEECDDSGTVSGAGCSQNCTNEAGFSCPGATLLVIEGDDAHRAQVMPVNSALKTTAAASTLLCADRWVPVTTSAAKGFSFRRDSQCCVACQEKRVGWRTEAT